jgi:hypothetical protein
MSKQAQLPLHECYRGGAGPRRADAPADLSAGRDPGLAKAVSLP